MSTKFITQDIWPELTKAVRHCRQQCFVAVAYFSKGASRYLPLPKGSCLVVDASEGTVKAGLTDPKELLKMIKRNVTIHSVSNLHAKVFVLGRTAYIGSANVSSHSANYLIEAVIQTTEYGAVRTARQFVRSHRLHQLTPRVLQQLVPLYRPPRVPGGQRRRKRNEGTSRRPALPRLLLAQLVLRDWSESDQQIHDRGYERASKLRKHPRSFELDSFQWHAKCPYQRNDKVIQVVNEGGGRVLVSPPGNVRYTLTRRSANRKRSFVYIERPVRRRRPLKSLASAIGHGSLKRLRKGGIVRDAAFAQKLLQAWAT